MDVTLPLGQPIVFGYQFYAFPLAILATEPAAEDWVLSNFIQLAYDARPEGADVPFCFSMYDPAISPWLETVRLSREVAGMFEVDPDHMLRSALRNGYYVYLDVDEYFVPRRRAFQTEHRSHDLLIHGFDDAAQAYRVYGFDAELKLARSDLPYALFRQAYTSPHATRPITERIHLYRLRRAAGYPLDVDLIRETLREYRAGENTSRHFAQLTPAWDRHWGAAGYEPLIRHVEAFGRGEAWLDMRHFHVLYEHKHLMRRRIERLGEHLAVDLSGPLADALEIRTLAHNLEMRMLIAEASNAPRRAAGAPAVIDAIRTREAAMIATLLDRLDRVTGPPAQERVGSGADAHS